jgi:hypothetical protein
MSNINNTPPPDPNRMQVDMSGGESFGYEDLIGKKGGGGMGDRISGAYQDVKDAMEAIKKAGKSGDPAALMDLQLKMNALTQVLSTTTQMINSMKQACEGVNRNL